MTRPIRILTAVPICDGHDSAILTINTEFIRHGIEVVYLGYHRSSRDIARAAIQEEVRAIGISSYNGGHVEFFSELLRLLRKGKASHIGVFGGGGGTITKTDATIMHRRGVDRIFFAGTPFEEMIRFVKERYGPNTPVATPSREEIVKSFVPRSRRTSIPPARVIGFTGPGGVGKTTLIDELVLRLLRSDRQSRIAILSHDPTLIAKGALLADRGAMIYSQDDRVFMHSLATHGAKGGLSPVTASWLKTLRGAGFDIVLVETVGIGQEGAPFPPGLVDRSVFVITPNYGSRLQLQKVVMLDSADIVVINKSDAPGGSAAHAEIEQRIRLNARGQQLVATIASRHLDTGVDQLFDLLTHS
jgi:methylmalonyl-CoA mutase cobalamin-binding domain/chain